MPSRQLRSAESSSPGTGTARRAYKSPTLSLFGPVIGLTMGSGGTGGDGSAGMTRSGGGMNMNMMSDRAAKQNIVRVATLPTGIGLYLFDYRPELRDLAGHGRQLGVMADEVEGVMSEAVSLHPSGYKMVDYGQLAINPAAMATTFHSPHPL